MVYPSLGESIDALANMENIAEVFLIGGQAIFEEALSD